MVNGADFLLLTYIPYLANQQMLPAHTVCTYIAYAFKNLYAIETYITPSALNCKLQGNITHEW